MKQRANHSSAQQDLDDNVIQEFLPLSDPHGLNQTTSIDRSTVARLHNQAQEGSVDSSYFLGLIYLYGLNNMTPDPSKAVKWFGKAASVGQAEAQCALGLILYHGLGQVGTDKKTAMRWFYQSSVDSKNKRAYWLLGRALYEGMTLRDIGVEQTNAASALGLDIEKHDDGIQSNFILAAHLFQKADGVHEAMHHLAIMYEYGLIPSDFPKDESIPRHEHYHERPRFPPNFERAAALYRNASNLGSTESLYNLALMYTYGRGVPLNYTKAKELFRQAALKNHAPSMRYLGLMAMNGWGQTEDLSNPTEAIHWLEKCIEYKTEQVQDFCERELKELMDVVEAAEVFRTTVLQTIAKTEA